MASFSSNEPQSTHTRTGTLSTTTSDTHSCRLERCRFFKLFFAFSRVRAADPALALSQIKPALKYFKLCVEEKPEFYQGQLKVAYLYSQMGKLPHAVQHLQHAVNADPRNPAGWGYLGDMLNNLKQFKKAAESYRRAVNLRPSDAKFRLHLADALQNGKRLGEAGVEYLNAYRLAPTNAQVLVGLLHCKIAQTNWTGYEQLNRETQTALDASLSRGEPSPMSPYQTLFLPLPGELKRRIAVSWAARTVKQAVESSGAASRDIRSGGSAWADVDSETAPKRLRVGYISRRFERYAGTQLMLRLFGLHDRAQFEIHAFAHGPDDGSTERQTVRHDSDAFHDISALSPVQAARAIAEQGIHVLIDYDGHHDFNNLQVLALRPAPVQVTFLGFAGTTGAVGAVDYIIADNIVIPDTVEARGSYTENIVYMPHTYQPQDHRIQFDMKNVPSRAELGLPKDAVVFANFNRNDKIDPRAFRRWCRVLRGVPNSVLWLLRSHAVSEANLKQRFAGDGKDDEDWGCGLPANRLIFAEKLNRDDHLHRMAAADLFLDTDQYNAHTLAAEALRVGLPVLTRIGETFPARVAASLLRASGLDDELVCETDQCYVDKAVSLGSDPERLARLRLKVREAVSGEEQPIYDTPLFTRHLEDAVRAMWDRARGHAASCSGEPASAGTCEVNEDEPIRIVARSN